MAEERQSTHWQGCWRVHHQCAIRIIELIYQDAEEAITRLRALCEPQQPDGDER